MLYILGPYVVRYFCGLARLLFLVVERASFSVDCLPDIGARSRVLGTLVVVVTNLILHESVLTAVLLKLLVVVLEYYTSNQCA